MTAIKEWLRPVPGGDSPEVLHRVANALSIRCPVALYLGVSDTGERLTVQCRYAEHHPGAHRIPEMTP